MASSSSTVHQWKNEVFLSFRGTDTRQNIISHLNDSLRKKSIQVFIDDQLRRGEKIAPALLQVIEESMISVIIFSKGYAFSTWCLEELEKIIECHEMYGQMVIPVFYGVDPSHVEMPMSGIYKEDFERHEKDLSDNLEQVESWKAAMNKAANISGWDSQVTRPDSILVGKIVEVILKRLESTSPSDHLEDFVGIDGHLLRVKTLLCIGMPDVRMLGIWGMGGIGKTTIARVVYNQIKFEFEGCCFLSNVGEELRKSSGLIGLGKKLLSDVLEEENIKLDTPKIGESIYLRRLSRRRVLIVLDDIDRAEQLEVLVGKTLWFGSGSRIIVTSRDKHVLERFVSDKYEVGELIHEDALLLFSRNAFKLNHPTEDFKFLSNSFVTYALGNPLALKVLGSFLFGRSKKEWESALARLRKCPDKDIQEVLRISYDGLHDEEKVIFLYIACFFNGENRDRVTRVLDACDLSTDIGVAVLVDKSLVTISPFGELHMHNLLQEMGRGIALEDCRKISGNHSRLCNYEDVNKVSSKDSVIEGIFLDMSRIKEMYLKPDEFKGMSNLKLFKFYFSNLADSNKVHLCHGLEHLPDELRYFYWTKYPAKSLPAKFQPTNLVELHLPESDVKWLWKGTKELQELKLINLKNSKHLIKLPNLKKATNVVDLNLEGCSNLVKVPTSISHLSQLTQLQMSRCHNIRNLPSLINLASLEYLDLSACSKLERFPDVSRNIEDIRLDGAAIIDVPSSIGSLDKLVYLSMEDCIKLKSVSSSIWELKSLGRLFLNGCSNLENLPKISEHALSYKREFVFYLNSCKKIRSIPELPPDVRTVYASGCTSLETIFGVEKFLKFQNPSHVDYNTKLDFSDCSNLDESALSKIVKNAIQDMATQVKNCPQGAPGFTLWYPGSEIPECFEYQAMGNSMTFQLPLCSHNNSRLFVLCAVVASRDHTSPPIIQCHCNFKETNGTRNSITGFYSSAQSSFALKSENVVIWFTEYCYVNIAEKCHLFGDSNYIDVSFEFRGFDRNNDIVKKCGIAVLCAKAEENIGMPTDLATNVSRFNEEEDEPHPKRLKKFMDIAESSRRQN